MLLGAALFLVMYFLPELPAAVDPNGKSFPLTFEGKAALGLFLLTAVWWVAEVIPIGITGIAAGVLQSLFLIRPARTVLTDYMDPSVWFIFASLVIGTVFSKTGLTKRMAYKMLSAVGERTSLILLGCFAMTAALTLVMAHTAVAATVYPLFVAVHSLYSDEDKPTRFGKALFIGMAFTAGAGSIITLLGSARAAVAFGFYKDISGRGLGFFELSYYMLPLGAAMVLLLWGFFMVYCPPERKNLPGLRERAQRFSAQLGPVSRDEALSLVIIFSAVAALSVRSFVPALSPLDKSAVLLVTTVLFFVFKILTLEDLDRTSWNIVLLFGGAMSIGFCLWQTGAAQWLAVQWLAWFRNAPGIVFVLGIAVLVLIMTNFIMNVAAIAVTLPVALVIAPYVGVSGELVLFTSLAAAGMPFLLLIGAAPNAIAYASRQFTQREFLAAGVPASLILMGMLALFAAVVWPAMGMPTAP